LESCIKHSDHFPSFQAAQPLCEFAFKYSLLPALYIPFLNRSSFTRSSEFVVVSMRFSSVSVAVATALSFVSNVHGKKVFAHYMVYFPLSLACALSSPGAVNLLTWMFSRLVPSQKHMPIKMSTMPWRWGKLPLQTKFSISMINIT
jgi:hypothetical protein